MQVRAAFLTWVSSALYELTRTGAIWEPTCREEDQVGGWDKDPQQQAIQPQMVGQTDYHHPNSREM